MGSCLCKEKKRSSSRREKGVPGHGQRTGHGRNHRNEDQFNSDNLNVEESNHDDEGAYMPAESSSQGNKNWSATASGSNVLAVMKGIVGKNFNLGVYHIIFNR